jgi:hypothetical protein
LPAADTVAGQWLLAACCSLLLSSARSAEDEEGQSLMNWENDDWDEDEGWNSDEEQGQGSWVGDAAPTPSKEKPKLAKLGAKLGKAKPKTGID